MGQVIEINESIGTALNIDQQPMPEGAPACPLPLSSCFEMMFSLHVRFLSAPIEHTTENGVKSRSLRRLCARDERMATNLVRLSTQGSLGRTACRADRAAPGDQSR